MRIVYIHYVYGEDTALHHVRQFADAMQSLGQDISVHGINLAPAGNGTSARPALRDWLKLRFSGYLHEPKEVIWNVPYVLREQTIIRARSPEVVLVRNQHLTFAPALARVITGVPLVLEVNAPAQESKAYLREYHHIPGATFIAERLNLRFADKVTVISDALRHHLARTHHVPLTKIVVNPNGANCQRLHPQVDPSDVRRRHGLNEDVVVGFLGTLHRWRGPDFLRALIESVERPGIRFLLVGDGPGWSNFRRSLMTSRARQSVVITGRVDHNDVPSYIAAMDIALVPDSSFYSCPLKLIEYMAAGRAVVAPRYPAVEELITHGEHGMLFPPGNVGAALQIIARLLVDRRMRYRLGRNAHRRVSNCLTWHHNAQRVLAACHSAVDTAKAQSR